MRDVSGALPIHYACRYYTSEAMFELFDDIATWSDWQTYDHKRPIDIAAEYGHIEIALKYLHKDKNPKGINALVRAAIRHPTGKISSYVKSTYPNEDDPIYYKTLHYACRQFFGHQSIKCVIFKRDMSTYDENGYIPLMLAVKHRQVQSVKELLESEYCTKEVMAMSTDDGTKRTVLHICAEANENSITDALLDKYSTLYKNNNELFIKSDVMKNTPFHTCAQKNNSYMCKQLIQYYKPKNNSNATTEGSKESKMWTMTNHNKMTALHEAIQSGHSEIVKTMHESMEPSDFKRMADIIDEELHTSLHLAAAKGQFR
jgi:hypothetical protein